MQSMYSIRKESYYTYIKIGEKEWRKDELASHIGISPHTLQKRIDAKWEVEELLSPPKRTNTIKTILYKGKETTFKELAKISGIDPSVLRGRYNLGIRDDDLIKPVQELSRTPVYVSLEDNTEELYNLARQYNIPEEVMYQRHYNGKRGKELIAPYKSKRSKYDLYTIGKVTKTIKEHALENKLDPDTLLRRINEDWEPEKLLAPFGTRFGKEKVLFRGDYYYANELSAKLSIPMPTVRRWINKDKDIEKMLRQRQDKEKERDC